MRTRALWAAAGVTLWTAQVLVGVPEARAEDPAKRANELYEMGNKLYDEQKWSEAEAAYQAAWDLKPSFDLAGNLADVETQVGQYRDAAEHFAYAYENFPIGGKPEVREALGKRLDDVKKQVGQVRVKTSVEGARVVVDGRNVGLAPLTKPVFVDPGQKVVEAKLEGFQVALKTIQVEKGATLDVNLVLVPMAAGGSAPGKKSVPLIVTGAALGVVGIGAGIGLFVAGGSRSDAAATLRAPMPEAVCNTLHPQHAQYASQCAELKDTLVSADLLHNAGIGVMIAGGLIGVGTLVYALWPKKKTSTYGLEVVPTVSPTFAGASASGRF